MGKPDLQTYVNCMSEIRVRIHEANQICGKEYQKPDDILNAEKAAIHIRKSIELILLSSLVVNGHLFEEITSRIKNCWEFNDIKKQIESVNKDFFPKPITHENGRILRTDTKSGNFATIEDLRKFHGECGNLLHAANPFKNNDIANQFLVESKPRIMQIINLLSHFTFTIPKTNDFFELIMSPNGSDSPILIPYSPTQNIN